MEYILPSQELLWKLERSEKNYMKDRMEAIQNRQGNPEGVEIAYFGDTICLYSKTMPWPAFNTVKGFSSADEEYIDDIIDFFRSRQRKVQFEIVPTRVDQRILAELSERGLYQSGFHTSMYGIPKRDEKPHFSDNVKIKELTEQDFNTYAEIHCRGTGLPDNGIPPVAENNKILWDRPGWKFFIAYVNDQAAATGVMHSQNGITSLTFAATLPEYRNQGLHRALLKARINESANQNELVVGQCAFLSQSHRNMESVGMRLGYVRTTWTER